VSVYKSITKTHEKPAATSCRVVLNRASTSKFNEPYIIIAAKSLKTGFVHMPFPLTGQK